MLYRWSITCRLYGINQYNVQILRQGKPRYDSYRPIVLTPHAAKLMEKIMLNILVHYCEERRRRQKMMRKEQSFQVTKQAFVKEGQQ